MFVCALSALRSFVKFPVVVLMQRFAPYKEHSEQLLATSGVYDDGGLCVVVSMSTNVVLVDTHRHNHSLSWLVCWE